MGWNFNANSRKELVATLLSPLHCGSNRTLIDHSLQGNKLWTLHQVRDEPGRKFITLHLLSGSGHRDGGFSRWGYKAVRESMGPIDYSCPKRLLDQSTCDAEFSVRWRQECKFWAVAERERKAFVDGLKPGDPFMVGERLITFSRRRIGSQYLIGWHNDTEYRWRLSLIKPVPAPAAVG